MKCYPTVFPIVLIAALTLLPATNADPQLTAPPIIVLPEIREDLTRSGDLSYMDAALAEWQARYPGKVIRWGYHPCDGGADAWVGGKFDHDVRLDRRFNDFSFLDYFVDPSLPGWPDLASFLDTYLFDFEHSVNLLSCDGQTVHTGRTTLEHLAMHFAWEVSSLMNRERTCVYVVAEGLSGLVVRYALGAVQEGQRYFPAGLCILEVVTMGTPHSGTQWSDCGVLRNLGLIPGSILDLLTLGLADIISALESFLSVLDVRCVQALPARVIGNPAFHDGPVEGSPFVAYLEERLRSPQGKDEYGRPVQTRWVLVGSKADPPWSSSLEMNADQWVVYSLPDLITQTEYLAPWTTASEATVEAWSRLAGGPREISGAPQPHMWALFSLMYEHWGCGTESNAWPVANGVPIRGPEGAADCFYSMRLSTTDGNSDWLSAEASGPGGSLVDINWAGSVDHLRTGDNCPLTQPSTDAACVIGFQAPGDKFFKISRSDGAESEFKVYHSRQDDCGWGADVGPTPKWAAPLSATIPVTCTGTLAPPGDAEDWFRFPLSASSAMRVTLTASDSTANFDLCVSWPNNLLERCDVDTGWGAAEEVSVYADAAEWPSDATWFIQVKSRNGGGAYTLKIEDHTNHAPLTPSLRCEPAGGVRAGEVLTCYFASTDPDDDLVAYSIDWGDGTTSRFPDGGTMTPDGTERSASHVYPSAGAFTIRVSATDEGGPALSSAASAVTRTIDPAPPTTTLRPVFESVSCPEVVVPGESFSCGFYATDADSTGIYYTINWGDTGGTLRVPASGFVAPGAAGASSAFHAYLLSGAYLVTVGAADKEEPTLFSTLVTKTIRVEAPAPAPAGDCGSTSDAGGTFGTAKLVQTPLSGCSGSLSSSDPEDWYQFDVAVGQRITIGGTSTNAASCLYEPSDATRAVVGCFDANVHGWGADFTAAEAGRWRVRVYKTDGPSSYSLVVTLGTIPQGNDCGTGAEAPPNPSDGLWIDVASLRPIQCAGAVQGEDAQDAFRFDAGAAVPVTVTLTSLSESTLGLGVIPPTVGAAYDYVSSTNRAPAAVTLKTDKSAGTWKIIVYQNGGGGAYDLSVKVGLAADDCNSRGDAPWSTSSGVFLSQSITCVGTIQEGDAGDTYKTYVEGGGSIRLSVKTNSNLGLHAELRPEGEGSTTAGMDVPFGSTGTLGDVVSAPGYYFPSFSGYWWIRVERSATADPVNPTGAYEITLDLKTDGLPPETTINYDDVFAAGALGERVGSNWIWKTPIEIFLDCSDAKSGCAYTEYSWGATGDWARYDPAGPPARADEGIHVFRYRSVDNAGNHGIVDSLCCPQIGYYQFAIDNSSPHTKHSVAPPDGESGWYRTAPEVTLSCEDSFSGCARTEYSLDGGASWIAYQGPFAVAGTGTKTLRYRSQDQVGFLEPTRILKLKVDGSAPTASLSRKGPLVNGWYVGEVTLQVNCADSGSGCARREYSWDGVTWTRYDPVNPPIRGTEGSAAVQYRSVDVAGNTGTVKESTFKIDRSPPATTYSLEGSRGADGWFVSAVGLTFSCIDAFSGCASTKYRMDGGNWTAYEGPLTWTSAGTYEIEFASADLAGRQEPARVLRFRIDAAPPATSVSAAGPNGESGWYRGAVEVTLACSDSTSGCLRTDYSRDGGYALTPYDAASPPTFASDGARVVTYRSRDVAGNFEGTRSIAVKVDATPPSASAVLSGPSGLDGWYVGAVTVAVEASDATSGLMEARAGLDGASLGRYGGTLPVSSDGVHALEYDARDVAGNSAAVQRVEFRIDATPPATAHALSGPSGDGGWLRGAAALTLSAADATSGVSVTDYAVNGSSWIPYAAEVPFAKDAVYSVAYRSRDRAGNVETAKTTEIRIDSVPPSVAAELSGSAGREDWFVGPVTIGVTASDATSGVAVTRAGLDGAKLGPYGTPLRVGDDGVHSLSFDARDVAGNVASPQSLGFRIDATPPSTADSHSGIVGDGGWFRGPVTSTLDCFDATSGCLVTEHSLDNGASWLAYDFSAKPLHEGDGFHPMSFRSRDVAGNLEGARSVTLRIDATPPTVTAEASGPKGLDGWFVGPVTVSIRGEDATSGVAGLRSGTDGAALAAYDRPFAVSPDGDHVVRFDGRDVAGNVALERGLPFRIDATPPRSSHALSGPAGAAGWFRGPVSVEVSATDATSANAFSGVSRSQYRVNGGSWRAYSGPVALEFDGVYAVDYRSIDRAGNVEAFRSVTVRIDATLPEAQGSILGPVGRNSWYTGEVEVVVEAADETSGVAVVRRVLDGGEWLEYEGPVRVGLDGSHSFEYDAVDVAGNGAPPRGLSFRIDSVPPASAHGLGGTPGKDGWFVSPVTVSLAGSDGGSGLDGVFYSLDGGPVTRSPGEFVVSREGGTTVTYAAEDLAGNRETAHSLSLRIDTVPPDAGHSLRGPEGRNGWFLGPTAVSLESSDRTSGVASHRYVLDEAPSIDFAGLFVVAADGDHRLEHVAVDRAGNSRIVREALRIDATPPTTSSRIDGTLGLDDWYVTPVEISLSARDATSGVEEIHVSVDGGPAVAYGRPIRFDADGPHSVIFWATDVAGNEEPVRHEISLRLDTTSPWSGSVIGTPSVPDPARGLFVRSHTPFRLVGDDGCQGGSCEEARRSGLDRIEYRTDGGAWRAFTGDFTPPPMNGVHTLEHGAIDRAGNEEAPRRVLPFTVDDLPPFLVMETPKPGSLTTPHGRYFEIDSDGDLHSDALENFTGTDAYDASSHAVPAVGGAYSEALASKLGNPERSAFVIAGSTVHVGASAFDNAGGVGVASVSLYVDGVLLAERLAPPFEFAWVVPEDASGEHVLRVVAADRLGNSVETLRSVRVLPASPEGVIATLGSVALPDDPLAAAPPLGADFGVTPVPASPVEAPEAVPAAPANTPLGGLRRAGGMRAPP